MLRIGFASLSQAGEKTLCQPKYQSRAMPAESSVLFSAAKMVLCPVAAGSRASPKFSMFGKVQTSWPQLLSVYRLAWQNIVLCVLLALVCLCPAGKRALCSCNASNEFRVSVLLVGSEKKQAEIPSCYSVIAQQQNTSKTNPHNKWFQRTAPSAQPLNQALAASVRH